MRSRALTERERTLFNELADVANELRVLHLVRDGSLRERADKLAKRLTDARAAYRRQ